MNIEQIKYLYRKYPNAFLRQFKFKCNSGIDEEWFDIEPDDHDWFDYCEYRLIPQNVEGLTERQIELLSNRAIYLGTGPLNTPDAIQNFNGWFLSSDGIFHDISVDSRKDYIGIGGFIPEYHYWIDVNDPNVDCFLDCLGYTIDDNVELAPVSDAESDAEQIHQLESEVASLDSEIEQAYETINERDEAIYQFEQKLKAVCAHRDEILFRNETLIIENHQLRECNNKMEEQLNKDLLEANQYVNELRGEIEDLEEQIEELVIDYEAEIEGLADERDEMNMENDDLSDHNDRLQEQVDRLESELDEIKYTNNNSVHLENEIENLRAEVAVAPVRRYWTLKNSLPIARSD